MDPIAAKYIGAGLACVGAGLSSVGIGVIYASIDQTIQKDRPMAGLFLTGAFGVGCFGLALMLLFSF